MKYLLLILHFSICSLTLAGSGGQEGGGGGFVHDNFIFYGKKILYYLRANPKGQKVQKQYNLNMCRLKNTLNENLIYVHKDRESMFDHRGSLVDAYTYRWAIHLHDNHWKKYFEERTDIYFLVFKEL